MSRRIKKVHNELPDCQRQSYKKHQAKKKLEKSLSFVV